MYRPTKAVNRDIGPGGGAPPPNVTFEVYNRPIVVV